MSDPMTSSPCQLLGPTGEAKKDPLPRVRFGAALHSASKDVLAMEPKERGCLAPPDRQELGRPYTYRWTSPSSTSQELLAPV